jgi:hypothetical protein
MASRQPWSPLRLTEPADGPLSVHVDIAGDQGARYAGVFGSIGTFR